MIEKFKKSLVSPLENEELHIFNSTYLSETCINNILQVINEEIYGIYVIGGFRGVGKTSIINLCSKKYSKSNLIRVTINCNKLVGVESFIYFFIEELYQQVHDLNLDNDILKELEDIKININNVVLNKRTNRKNAYVERKNQEDNTKKIQNAYGFKLFKDTFSLFNKKELVRLNKNTESVSDTNDIVQEIEERREKFILIDRIVKVVNKICRNAGSYNILLIVDEMDKQDEKIIEELLSCYKNLFFNTNMITFFVVDTLQYIRINSGNLLDNKMLNYITKSIYIPTLNKDELRDYLYREFDIDNYEEVIIINYLSQGIYRKLNVYKYLNGYRERETFNKAYLYYEVSKELENLSLPLYIKDLLLIIFKDIIEELFVYGEIKLNDIKRYLIESKNKYYYKFSLDKLLISLKKVFNDTLILKHVYLLRDDIVYMLNEDINLKMQFEYRNKKIIYDTKLSYINKYIDELEPIYVKVSNNNPDDYRYIIRLIQTISNEIKNIYFIKKITDFGESYSVAIEVNKDIGQVMYVVEDFSFSYECFYAIKALNEYFEEVQITIPWVEIDDEPIKENIKYIREKVKKIIDGEY